MSVPTQTSSGPLPGDPVSRAAGYIGLAKRYGHDVEEARQVFRAAKLEKEISKVGPTLSKAQCRKLAKLLAASGK